MSEKIYKRNLAQACEEYNKIFGANKNLYRIMPSFQDGLKPVQRRFLYSLYRGKGRTQFIKMAKAAADTTAMFHPHGSASVEDVGAKLASPICNNIPVVEGQGNFGSYKSDKAGASRYIECRLSKYALKCFFEDFENSNVDMKLAYTGDDYEPEVLPSRYPHALFNPQLSGIGYAFASNLPPFNITEVLETTIKLIKNPKSKVYLVPDSPTGASVVDDGQFEDICKTGVGTFTLRGNIDVNAIENTLTITSIPLQTTIDSIITKIVELREKKVFDEIREIKDYTKNKTGVKCVIYLDQSANPNKTIEKLYSKNIGLKKTYPVGMKMIDDYKDIDYGVKSFLLEWIEYRRDTVRSSYNTMLVKAMENQNINDVLLFVLNSDNAETTIKMAKQANNKQEFAEKLIKKYSINSQQANTIANMRIYAFSKDAYKSYKERKEELKKEIKRLEDILDDDNKIDDTIIEQLKEGIKLFGCPRKSKVVSETEEDDIVASEHIISISSDGYIKKLDSKTKSVGQVGNLNGRYMTMKINNRDSIIVFDSTGKASKISINAIPNMKVKDSGILLERYFSVHGKVISVLIEPTKSELKKRKNDLFIVFITKLGFVKKTYLSEFYDVNGTTQAIKIPATDELVGTDFVSDNTIKDMVIYTNLGNGIRRDINEFPVMKSNARGVRQLSLKEDEYCIDFSRINPDKKYILYITSSGNIKITDLKYFPTMNRKDDTISLIGLNKTERLVAIHSINKTETLVVYRKNGEPVEIELKDLPITTRAAKADKIVKVPKGDTILSYTLITR